MREREIFNIAVKVPPDHRAALLDAMCGSDRELRQQLDELLQAHDDPGSFFIRPGDTEPARARDKSFREEPGTLLDGRFKLLESIGEGGMGTVWVAEQLKPVRRKVAIKLVKAGMDSKQVLARFDTERQALAVMDHPNIAKVFDSGISEYGRPFFVMEYVKGVPLTEYCDQARLPIHHRLALFVSVCQAVQHAHQKGIIHRDLKPSNILVCLYDGVPIPKVIDFGLAKAMHQRLTDHTVYTGHGLMLGTPLYMSPEQAEFNNLDIDTRSDIYSLGVILYELLTGSTPLDKEQFQTAALDETLRLIKEVEPPKPSTRLSGCAALPNIAAQRSVEPAQLSRALQGDLDWIVMKALDKQRSRRYESANGLARDVQRFLNDEVVEAIPPSTTYLVRKFAHKHRVAINIAAAFALLLLLGTAISAWQAIRATRAENEVQRAFENEIQQRQLAQAKQREAERSEEKARKSEAVSQEEAAKAEAARKQAQEQLYESLVNQAEARLTSRRIGHRLDTLKTITAAASIRRTDKLRDLAISALALPDIETVRTFRLPEGATFTSLDGELRRAAIRFESGKRVEVWDTLTNTQLRTISGKGSGQVGKLSPDGRWLVHFDPPHATTVWEVDAETDAVRQFASRDFEQVTFDATGTQSAVYIAPHVTIYDLSHWEERQSLRIGPANHVVFRPGQAEIAWSTGTKVIIGRLSDGMPRITLDQTLTDDDYGTNVELLAWHPDGRQLAVECDLTRIRLWDVESRVLIGEIPGDTAGGNVLAYTSDGDALLTSGWTSRLHINAMRALRQWFDVFQSTTHLHPQAGPNRTFIGLFENGHDLPIMRYVGGRELITAEPLHPKSSVLPPAVHPSGHWWVTAVSRTGTIEVRDMVGRLLTRIAAPTRIGTQSFDASALSFDASGNLYTMTPHGLYRWPIQQMPNGWMVGPPNRLPISGNFTYGVSADGRRVMSYHPDLRPFVQSSDSVDDAVTLGNSPSGNIDSSRLSPDGHFAVTRIGNKTAVWKTDNGKLVTNISLQAIQATFSPDGRWLLLIGMPDTELALYSVDTWTKIRSLGSGYSAAFSPDGTQIVCVEATGVLRLVETATGRTLARLHHPEQHSGLPTFSPDGTRVLALRADANAVFLWDLRLIREQLGKVNLDWEAPPFAPASEEGRDRPTTTTIQLVGVENLRPVIAPDDFTTTMGGIWWKHEQGDDEQALADLTALIAMHPADSDATTVLSVIQAALHDALGHHQSADDTRAALRRRPNAGSTLNGTAWNLLMTLNDRRFFALGLLLAQESHAIDPMDANAGNTLGLALYRNGRHAEAINALEHNSTRRHGTSDSFDLFVLAMARHQLGDTDAAVADFNRANRRVARLSSQLNEFALVRFEAESLLFATGNK